MVKWLTDKIKKDSPIAQPKETWPFQMDDKVRNTVSGVVGTVVAVYETHAPYNPYTGLEAHEVIVLDVRQDGRNSIWYGTPASNWTLIHRKED